MATHEPFEAVHLWAVIGDMALDLLDRGMLSQGDLDSFNAWCEKGLRSKGWDPLVRDLPCMGKALDAYLLTDDSTNRSEHQQVLETLWVSCVPILGTSFATRLIDGPVEKLDPVLVRAIRELAYLFYKYELPHTKEQIKEAIDKFVARDQDLAPVTVDVSADTALCERIFRGVDLSDIHPSHGPGTVSLKEFGAYKYDWTGFATRTMNVYSMDYFTASPSHLSEVLDHAGRLPELDLPARLLTVPKDSRGPRVISCEPKEFQWLQQGIRKVLYDWLEQHPLTRGRIHFRDQEVNGRLALEGSRTGRYATLDLSEASDRVALDYVQSVLPEDVLLYVMAARSSATVLPNKMTVVLKKFGPMGSALCFPILGLTCFLRLQAAGIRDCHVYGDDVVCPTTQVEAAIHALEAIGLKVNRAKSCFSGFFRESCGVDAFRGINVTPLKIKKRWSSRRGASTYVSWIAYANSLHVRGYVRAAERIARSMAVIYGPIPFNEDSAYSAPCFRFVTGQPSPSRRVNARIQTLEERVWTICNPKITFQHNGYYKLLNWFSKASEAVRVPLGKLPLGDVESMDSWPRQARTTSEYTARDTAYLERAWVPTAHVSDMSPKSILSECTSVVAKATAGEYVEGVSA